MVLFFTLLSAITALAGFLLGLLVLLKNPLRNQNFSFFVFTWFITIWSVLSYAFFVNQGNVSLYKIVYAMGGVSLVTTAPWILYIVKEKPNKLLIWGFYALAAYIFSIPFWDKNAISGFMIHSNQLYTFNVDFVYYLSTAAVFATVLFVFYQLIRHLIVSSGYKKYQIIYILVGLSLYFFGELLFGVILPMLNLTPSAPLDDLGAITFVAFSAYAFLALDRDSIRTEQE